MHHIIVAVIDYLMYERCIHINPSLDVSNIQKHPCKNKIRNAHISVLYNEFLNQLDMVDDGWLIFCHEDFEFLENPIPLLEKADKNAIYGVFGARITQNLRGEYFREFIGEIFDNTKKGTNPQVLGTSFRNGEVVDTLDCQCMMVHTSIVLKYKLRFDSALSFNMYVEDFCLSAYIKHAVKSRVLCVRCRHHSQVITLEDRPSFPPDLAICEKKYQGTGRRAGICNIFNPKDGPPLLGYLLLCEKSRKDDADIYHNKAVDKNNHNIPSVLAASQMHRNSTILDVGCASGNNGLFFKHHLNSTLWGLEYNPVSVECAKKTGAYEDVLLFNMDSFYLNDYSRFYGFFDYLYIADVLEHLVKPLRALQKISCLLSNTGSCIVSLPNVAHAHIITDLCRDEFNYHDDGILDATQLRFFTRTSMARLFSDAGFAVITSMPIFYIPDELDGFYTHKHTFHALRKLINTDIHFFIYQYVSVLQKSNKPFKALFEQNLKQLEQAQNNNPQGWNAKRPALKHFLQAVRLSCENYPPSLRTIVQEHLRQNNLNEAIYASKLFSHKWYIAKYPEATLTPNGQTTLEHYLSIGWRKGYNPSEHFDTQWYLSVHPELIKLDICPLLHYITEGMIAGHPYNAYMAQLHNKATGA